MWPPLFGRCSHGQRPGRGGDTWDRRTINRRRNQSGPGNLTPLVHCIVVVTRIVDDARPSASLF